MPKMSKMAQAAYDVAFPIAAQMGYDLVDCEYVKEGKDLFLRMYIDKKGGISTDDCEAFSRKIDPILDESINSEADYFEVSSPGLTRPLETASDYKRYQGEMMDVSLYMEVDGTKSFSGTIECSDEENVTFDTNKIGLTENIAIASAFCKAILFGNNSPKTKVIYDSITVTTTKAISLLYGIPILFNNSPKVPDNPVAADALEKNPARVIPT